MPEELKINGIVESPAAGALRRRTARVGDAVPVGGLLGVLADPTTLEAEIDAIIGEFEATFRPEAADVPILALWGEHDRVVPPSHAAALPARARVEIVRGAGHMPQLEASGEVNRLIDEFLAGAGA